MWAVTPSSRLEVAADKPIQISRSRQATGGASASGGRS